MSFQTCLSFCLVSAYFELGLHCHWLVSIVGTEIQWKSIGPINYLITSILQNISLYVQHMKETHTGLEQNENE